MITGFNNTYVGDFVGTLAVDESDTIRIGDVSNGNGAGSLQCYIGGIFNNFQPVGGSIVVVTLDRVDDHLGWDFGPSQGGSEPVQRSAPQRRSAPGTPTQRPAMLNGKVGKVDTLEAMVAQQQIQIETLTAQLREQAQTFTAQLKEQAAQIQKVSAQLEVSKRAPQVANNPQSRACANKTANITQSAVTLHHVAPYVFLNSPACSCVSITLRVSS